MKVMFVEDNDQIVKVMKRMLRGDVRFFTTVEEAIITLENGEKFDVIFSDHDLAGQKSGEHLLDWVKANQPEMVENFFSISGNPAVEKLYDKSIEKHDFRTMQKIITKS